MPTDYTQSKIYRLVCSDSRYYIGSTVLKLITRFGQHRRAVENGADSKVYRHVRAIGGPDHFKIELVAENLGITTRDELLKIEDSYIREALKNKALCLNRNKPRATDAERIAREKMQAKMWTKINRDKYREEIAGKESEKTTAERVREFYRTHKPAKPRKAKADPEELVSCECGMILMRARLSGHKKTIEHGQELMRWRVVQKVLYRAWKLPLPQPKTTDSTVPRRRAH